MTSFSYSYRMDPQELSVLGNFVMDMPVKIGALASALGLKVVIATLPLSVSGLIKPDEDGGYVIKVNRFESKERQRFTIAHEIAHYLIHKDKIRAGVVDSVLYRSKLSSRAEAEANKLAAEIVMPSSLVVEALATLSDATIDEKVNLLAEKFGVSKHAMSIRLG